MLVEEAEATVLGDASGVAIELSSALLRGGESLPYCCTLTLEQSSLGSSARGKGSFGLSLEAATIHLK